MDFFKFFDEYIKCVSETTSEQINEAFKISDKKLNKNKQYEKYKNHLSKLLHLPPTMEWYHTKDNQQFLTVTGLPWLPFNIKGISDLVILNSNYSKVKSQESKDA
ncbi:hypothetical protein GLOIN_2v1485529 [Rhizophagus irregularis DAOM 181602=DAOM 197198]|nr:hypothetical protein GLOIN_2v1485529 [Rhizophagus irregularis DAOM 181602=DAOM 197198]CAG8554103.1 8051_t:CDS:2 [Rhizophagus irregularis]